MPGGGTSSPAVSEDLVYSGSRDHNLYARDARDGRLRWQAATGGELVSSPAVAGGVVYIGSLDKRLYAFHAASGQLLWTALTGALIDASPVVANGLVYIGSHDSKLYAFDAAGASGCSGIPRVCQPRVDGVRRGPGDVERGGGR